MRAEAGLSRLRRGSWLLYVGWSARCFEQGPPAEPRNQLIETKHEAHQHASGEQRAHNRVLAAKVVVEAMRVECEEGLPPALMPLCIFVVQQAPQGNAHDARRNNPAP